MTGPRSLAREIELPASLGSLRPFSDWLKDAARAVGLSEETAVGLDHALHEAVENVVRYAWDDPTGRSVKVCFRSDRHGVEVEVEDDGRPFDPRTVPDPVAPAGIEQVVPGGYGIAMIRHFTDELRYQRVGRRNRLTLVRRPAAGSGE